MKKARQAKPSPEKKQASPATRRCDQKGCQREGIYRAPQSTAQLGSYFWFCLEHVRLYNASWNYGGDWTPEQIEQKIRHDALWERQPHPMHRQGDRIEEILRDKARSVRAGKSSPVRNRTYPPHLPRDVRNALDFFDLPYPLDTIQLRTRYLHMVKEYHPDTRRGDSRMEEQLKKVTHSYTVLKSYLEPLTEE